MWDETVEKSFWHTMDFIKHCADNGVVFNPKKFTFGQDEVEFAGYTVTKDGIKPSAKMVDAILNFPTPTSISGVRSWFVVVNQVAFAFSQAQAMTPFRELLRTKNMKFYWDEALERIFEESKRKIVEQIEHGVKTFDMD